MSMYTAILNTSGQDYDSIIITQALAFEQIEWASHYNVRLSLDWTRWLARIFWAEPTWDTVLATQATPQATMDYIAANDAEWNAPIPN